MERKKHLVIMCGIFFPEPSPTGLCVKRFANLLAKYYDIDILCISSNGKEEVIKGIEGYTIYTLCGGVKKFENSTKGILHNTIHQLGRIQIKLFTFGNLTWYIKRACRCLEKINELREIDAIFSVSSPIVAHVSAKKYKRKNNRIHWCAYTVDPYSTKDRIKPFMQSIKKLIRVERDILLCSDTLLLSEEVYRTRNELFYNHSNCEVLPYMLPNRSVLKHEINHFNQDDINCVYAGRFYEDIRNPRPMLEAFHKGANANIKLHLFSIGCEDIVDKYVESSSQIIKHNLVSHEKINEVYAEADVLISLMNNSNEFLPSKTFEYIVTGKPIISFYYDKPCKELDMYPLALQINIKDSDIINKLNIFIAENAGHTVLTEVIEEIYSHYSQENILRILKKSLR